MRWMRDSATSDKPSNSWRITTTTQTCCLKWPSTSIPTWTTKRKRSVTKWSRNKSRTRLQPSIFQLGPALIQKIGLLKTELQLQETLEISAGHQAMPSLFRQPWNSLEVRIHQLCQFSNSLIAPLIPKVMTTMDVTLVTIRTLWSTLSNQATSLLLNPLILSPKTVVQHVESVANLRIMPKHFLPPTMVSTKSRVIMRNWRLLSFKKVQFSELSAVITEPGTHIKAASSVLIAVAAKVLKWSSS